MWPSAPGAEGVTEKTGENRTLEGVKKSLIPVILSEAKNLHGYGGFSVSPAHVEKVAEYIAQQETHHRGVSFQEEYRRLLKRYGVEYDERYVWD